MIKRKFLVSLDFGFCRSSGSSRRVLFGSVLQLTGPHFDCFRKERSTSNLETVEFDLSSLEVISDVFLEVMEVSISPVEVLRIHISSCNIVRFFLKFIERVPT